MNIRSYGDRKMLKEAPPSNCPADVKLITLYRASPE